MGTVANEFDPLATEEDLARDHSPDNDLDPNASPDDATTNTANMEKTASAVAQPFVIETQPNQVVTPS